MALSKTPSFRRLTVLFIVMTTGAAIWFSHPAQAQLAVSGPSDLQTKQLQSWYDHHIPARFRAHSRLVIRELYDAQMDAYLKGDEDCADPPSPQSASHTDDDGDGDIDGVFESDPDRIALRLPADGGPDLFTFAHEYGHYVWFHLLSKDDRKRYEAIYNRQRAAHRLVTHYAETDLEEGFAEAFSFYACEPQFLAHRDLLSYQFLNQCPSRA